MTEAVLATERKNRWPNNEFPWVTTTARGELLDKTMQASIWPRGIWSDKLKSPCNHKEEKLPKRLQMHKDRKIIDYLNFTGNLIKIYHEMHTRYLRLP